jgi:hypothetical protein
MLIRVFVAETVEWRASIGVTKERVCTMEEEEGDDAGSAITIVFEFTSKMESCFISMNDMLCRQCINEDNNALVLQEALHTVYSQEPGM